MLKMNSNKFILKYFESTFKDISPVPWYRTWYEYIIDSKYRTAKRLDLFLKEQLVNIDDRLLVIALGLRKKTPDQTIINILRYVYNRVKYVKDSDSWGMTEKWVTAYDTWKAKRGDCEDINNLIYVLGRLSGISSIVLWCAIGDVKEGGHFWLMYYSTKHEFWYAIDGAYYVDYKEIQVRNPFKFSNTKYKKFWYIFNENNILKQR